MAIFNHIPNYDELLAVLPQINWVIAEEMLYWSNLWSKGNEVSRLRILNHLVQEVDRKGAEKWEEIVRSTLINLIRLQRNHPFNGSAPTGR